MVGIGYGRGHDGGRVNNGERLMTGATVAGGVVILAGLWLVASPWVLGYTIDDAVWNPTVAGAVIVLLALAGVFGNARVSVISGLTAAIGVWLLASALWLAGSHVASLNVWFTGVVVLVVSVWSLTTAAAAGSRR